MPKLLATTYYSMKGCVRPSIPLQKIKSFVTRQAETIQVTTFSCKTCFNHFLEKKTIPNCFKPAVSFQADIQIDTNTDKAKLSSTKRIMNCLISARLVITDLIFCSFLSFFGQSKKCVTDGPTD